MSFEKRQNWLTRNQSRVALTVAVAAVGVWGCQVATPNAPGGEDSVNRANGNGQLATGTPGTKTGSSQAGTNTTVPGGAQVNAGTGSAITGPTGLTQGSVDPASVKPAAPGTTALTGQPTLPMNPAVANTTPIVWNTKVGSVTPEDRALFPVGEATLVGRVVDQFGKPAANIPVSTDTLKTTTNAEGWYELKVAASPDLPLQIGGNAAGYVPFNDFLTVFPDTTFRYDTQVLGLDKHVTKINVKTGGIATSAPLEQVLGEISVDRPSAINPKQAFGLFDVPEMTGGMSAVYLIIPPDALELPPGQEEAEIKLTWLNPMPRDGKPFGDLYGPLETRTEWDSAKRSGTPGDKTVAFAPVNFADLDLGNAKIKPGAEVKVKWVVGPEVLTKYPITMQNGQAFMPCYQYENGDGWVKPVLATITEERGYTWSEYGMRGSNSPTVVPE